MRILMALSAAVSCGILGMLASRRLALRKNALDTWAAALSRMEGIIVRGGAGLRDMLILSGAGKLPALAELAERVKTDPAAAPEALLSALHWDPLLTAEEKDALAECLLSLFSPDPEMQRRAVSRCREQTDRFRETSRAAWQKNGRLYGSLGWLAGAALFILFI